jgi:molybdopterin molybdotransferase
LLGCDIGQNDERADYLRATLKISGDGLPVATPFPVQDSSMLVPLARADCLLVREASRPGGDARQPLYDS